MNEPPINAAEMISYQDGSVVSKTLVKNEAGTVTLFAFDKGEALSEHTAPFDALVHLIDGSVEISIEGRKYIARSGEIVILPANRPHSLAAVERFKMILTMIRA